MATNRPMRLLAILLFVATCLPLAGCIVLPVPIPATGTRVDEEARKLVVGVTTRAELRALLGPPAHTPTARDDVWALERDPFHLLWIIAFGGPGYAAGGAVRTGEPAGFAVLVAYDEDDRLRSWTWLAADGRRAASGADGLLPTAFQPLRRLSWLADQALVETAETLLLVQREAGRRLRVERRDLVDGRVLATWSGGFDDCGGRPMGALASTVRFALVEAVLVSVPTTIGVEAPPCRWTMHRDGALVGEPLGTLALGEGPQGARLAGNLLLFDDLGGGVSIVTLAGERLARVPRTALIGEAAEGGGRVLFRTIEGDGRTRFRHLEIATGTMTLLPALEQPDWSAPCASGPLALAPDGRTAARRCPATVELWSLPEAGDTAILERVLPFPPDHQTGGLAFSADGRHLVLAAHRIVVWRTVDGALEAFLPRSGSTPVATSVGLSLTPDGMAMATSTGLWQLAGPSSPEG